jgi:hypothetical protein
MGNEETPADKLLNEPSPRERASRMLVHVCRRIFVTMVLDGLGMRLILDKSPFGFEAVEQVCQFRV